MRLKLTRNIGRDDLKQLGLVTDDKDIASALTTFAEGTAHEFDSKVGEFLVKRGLAEADDGVDTRPMRGVSPAPAVATPANFRKNPHDTVTADKDK